MQQEKKELLEPLESDLLIILILNDINDIGDQCQIAKRSIVVILLFFHQSRIFLTLLWKIRITKVTVDMSIYWH